MNQVQDYKIIIEFWDITIKELVDRIKAKESKNIFKRIGLNILYSDLIASLQAREHYKKAARIMDSPKTTSNRPKV